MIRRDTYDVDLGGVCSSSMMIMVVGIYLYTSINVHNMMHIIYLYVSSICLLHQGEREQKMQINNQQIDIDL